MKQSRIESAFSGFGADGLGSFGDISHLLRPYPLHAKTKMIMAVNDIVTARERRLTSGEKFAIVPPSNGLLNIYFELAQEAVTESNGKLGGKFIQAGTELIELGLHTLSHHPSGEKKTAQFMINAGINLILGQYLHERGSEYRRNFTNLRRNRPFYSRVGFGSEMTLDNDYYWPEKMSADFMGYFLGFTKILTQNNEEIGVFWEYFMKTIFGGDVPSMFAGLYYIIKNQENAPISSTQKEFLKQRFFRYLDSRPIKRAASLHVSSFLLLGYPTYDDTYDYREVLRHQDRNFFLVYFGLMPEVKKTA